MKGNEIGDLGHINAIAIRIPDLGADEAITISLAQAVEDADDAALKMVPLTMESSITTRLSSPLLTVHR